LPPSAALGPDDAQAVNVLSFGKKASKAITLTGIGLVRDIEANLGFSIAGKRVLLLGAGGAAQGAVGPLLATQPALLAVGQPHDGESATPGCAIRRQRTVSSVVSAGR
jgi:shikimate dehydrogenase